MPFIKNINDLEKLNCIEIHNSTRVGFDLKKIVFKIKNTNFFIETQYWRGDDFYCYDVNYFKIYNNKTEPWSFQECLLDMPEDVQMEILMNLDLFTRI